MASYYFIENIPRHWLTGFNETGDRRDVYTENCSIQGAQRVGKHVNVLLAPAIEKWLWHVTLLSAMNGSDDRKHPGHSYLSLDALGNHRPLHLPVVMYERTITRSPTMLILERVPHDVARILTWASSSWEYPG
jgi:hypothetical protein